MSYTPQTWVNGDIITATKLNNIESGVQSVSNSYTPTTWVNGDIITAVKLNNIEQGIANAGGGGSSDFSTAEVTVVNNANTDAFIGMPCIYEAGSMGSGSPAFIIGDVVPFTLGMSHTENVALYKGLCLIRITDFTVAVSGDATAQTSMVGTNVLITGDCTITIS